MENRRVSERYIGLPSDSFGDVHAKDDLSQLRAVCLSDLKALEGPGSYFTLCALLSELHRGGSSLDIPHICALLREKLRACYVYPPSVCKVLEIVEFMADSDVFPSSVSFAEDVLATLNEAMSAPVPPACPTSSCRLIDQSMSDHRKALFICVSHRICNQLLRHHNADLGLSCSCLSETSLSKSIDVLLNNDKLAISFLVNRTEIYLRIKRLPQTCCTAITSKLVETLDPFTAFWLFQMKTGLDEIFWLDLLNSEETKALEYMLRMTQLFGGDRTSFLLACQRLFAEHAESQISVTREAVAAADVSRVTIIWDSPPDGGFSQASSVTPDDWTKWQKTSQQPQPPVASYSNANDVETAVLSFLSRLLSRLRLFSSDKGSLVFNPTIITARIEAFLASVSASASASS